MKILNDDQIQRKAPKKQEFFGRKTKADFLIMPKVLK